MTSDAKIGLLLGLVFIFIIAFVINGLPTFREDRNNNELTTSMVGLRNNPPGIAAKEREIITPKAPVEKHSSKVVPSSVGNQDIRFEMALPAVGKNKNRKSESNKATLPKIYVVNEGDSLAAIAKKFYGSHEGSKGINITRIFEANRKLLRSPDEIYVGQKLIIPPLSASAPSKGRIVSVFPAVEFMKVESIGKRRLSTDSSRTRQSRWHIVREGDSLWQIAAEKLGDGSRYSEIAELNAGILDDEDSLPVGMRLKMPVR